MGMLRKFGFALVLIIVAGSIVPITAAVRLGTIYVGGGYGYYGGPYWSGYYPAPFYSPWFYSGWYSPWWGYPAYAPVYFSPQIDKGQVVLQTRDKSAQVYLDGAYAGTASKLKNFWLAPGVYQLEVRAAGQPPIGKRIYVLTGKTLKVRME